MARTIKVCGVTVKLNGNNVTATNGKDTITGKLKANGTVGWNRPVSGLSRAAELLIKNS